MFELTIDTPTHTVLNDKQLALAIARALHKTTQYVSTQLKRRLGDQLAINQQALKKRVFTQVSRDKAGRASIWIGLNDLPAHRLGRVRQTRAGATVRRYHYRGAFVVQRGETAVAFRRASSDHATTRDEVREYHTELSAAEKRGQRLPINRVGLHIDVEGEAIADALGPALHEAFARFLDHEIDYLQGQSYAERE